MLSLDDPRWERLDHAYGSAGDVPALIKKLHESTVPQQDHKAEAWFSLWSSLCHQDDVYTASYAAVPHVVQIAREATSPIDPSFFQFPAAVEISRAKGRGPQVPEFLADDYERAVAGLADLVCLHSTSQWDRATLLSAAAAQAVAKADVEVAEALLNLDDDWIRKIRTGESD